MAQVVGKVKELWRYPVKSMVGEALQHASIEHHGLHGDRCWTVRDDVLEENVVVRTLPKLLMCSATYVEDPAQTGVSHVRIRLPDGSQAQSSDPGIGQILSRQLGKPLSLWPLQPLRNWRHYRLKGVVNATRMKRMFATKELPDLSSVSWKLLLQLMFFSSPPGRYYDAYPLHVVTTGSMRMMKKLEPEGDFDACRFRPNLVIESNEGIVDFDDFSWVGGHLHIGDLIIRCESRTVRCLMPSQPQAGVQKDSKVLRAINRHTGRHFGINATVVRRGAINVGDQVTWVPERQTAVGKKAHAASSFLKNRISHGLLTAADLISRK